MSYLVFGFNCFWVYLSFGFDLSFYSDFGSDFGFSFNFNSFDFMAFDFELSKELIGTSEVEGMMRRGL